MARWTATWAIAVVTLLAGCDGVIQNNFDRSDAIGDATGDTAPDSTGDVASDAAASDVSDDPLDMWEGDLGVSDLSDQADIEDRPEPPDAPEISSERLELLQEGIDTILGDDSVDGRDLSAYIIDLETGQVLYQSDPDLVLAPASNTKVFTTAAALSLLGPEHRFLTRVFADAGPDGDGVIDGDIYLLGEHDFSFSEYYYQSARFPLDQLVAQLTAQGVREVTGTVWAYGEFVYDGHRFGDLDTDTHRQTTLNAFVDALEAGGVDLGGSEDTQSSFDLPDGVQPLAEWRSPPLSVLCSPINRTSHNEFADMLSRHLGWVRTGESSYEAGTAEVEAWLSGLDIDDANFELHDGSGLSYDNRVSARQVVGLYAHMLSQPIGRTWLGTMSVAGVRGTLAGRMTGDDTHGRVFGKSGTLNISICTSGVLFNRHDGHRYIFSLLMNNHPTHAAARSVQNQTIEAVAADLRDAGSRPEIPDLLMVQNRADVSQFLVTFEPVDGAQGYWIWRSDDGVLWDRARAEYHLHGPALVAPLDLQDVTHIRVTAVSSAGESDPSDTYAGRSSSATQVPVLIVDGNQRWQAQPVDENTLGGSHDFVANYANAIDGRTFDSVSNTALIRGYVELADYDAVVWGVAEDAEVHDSFDLDEQLLIEDFTAGGGSLFVSGAEIGWDLARGRPEELSFFERVFRASYATDDAGTYLVEGSGGVFATLSVTGFYTPDDIVVSFPDTMLPSGGSLGVLNYVGGNGGIAGVQHDGGYRLVHLGFPFESIDNATDREAVMSAVLEFLLD